MFATDGDPFPQPIVSLTSSWRVNLGNQARTSSQSVKLNGRDQSSQHRSVILGVGGSFRKQNKLDVGDLGSFGSTVRIHRSPVRIGILAYCPCPPQGSDRQDPEPKPDTSEKAEPAARRRRQTCTGMSVSMRSLSREMSGGRQFFIAFDDEASSRKRPSLMK